MAFIHTNYLTGNNTTGDGSAANPFQWIGQALNIANSGDTIKVAGGQWLPVTGDFTFTNSSVTVNTSISQVGIIAVNDVLTFEDGQFGFDKFHVRVTAVTTTTLTLSAAWTGTTQVCSSLFRIGVYHYSTALNLLNFESWRISGVAPFQPNTLPNGRTNITISGGWDDTFTVQNGWTVVRSTSASNPGGVYLILFGPGNSLGYLGDWKNNLIFDRIFMSRITGLLSPQTPSPTQISTFAVKEIGIIRGTTETFINSPQTKWGGLYQADVNTPVTIYANPEASTLSFTNMNAINASNPSASTLTNITVYQQAGASTTGGTTAGTVGLGVINSATQASPNKITLHTRSSYVTPGALYYGSTPAAYATGLGYTLQGSYYLQKAYIYCNLPTIMQLPGAANYYLQVEDLEFTGPYGSSINNALYFGGAGKLLIDISQEGKTIQQFKPQSGYTYGSNSGFDLASFYNLPRLGQTNLSGTQIKDAEGLKTMDLYNSVYFKDPVNNWLRVTGNGIWGNDAFNYFFNIYSWKLIGVKEKIYSPFTVTVRLKDDGNGGNWNRIALQYGPNLNQVVFTDISATTSFADYYITVNPAAISDWNSTSSFPMYIGIRSYMWNVNSDNQQASSCFIESINIS
jgi:hypothetical protein